MSLNGIYPILPDTKDEKLLIYQVTQSIKAGVKIIQYRDKTSKDIDIENIAKKLCGLCQASGVKFIINDRVHLAQVINADGVHIGTEDMSIKETRAIIGDKIIGVSCYGDMSRALALQQYGADYVAFGAMFGSFTKPNAKTIKLDIDENLHIPICVIGGITSQNISSIKSKHINMYAVISDIYKDDNIIQNIQRLQHEII